MRSQGLGLGGSIDNCIIVDNNEIINPEGLRHENEFSRHKLLDAIADIYTSGYRIQGRYQCLRCDNCMQTLLLPHLLQVNENDILSESSDKSSQELNRWIDRHYHTI